MLTIRINDKLEISNVEEYAFGKQFFFAVQSNLEPFVMRRKMIHTIKKTAPGRDGWVEVKMKEFI